VAPFLSTVVIVLFAIATREYRLMAKILWLPGILLFLAVSLPWYIAVDLRNPQFFREFILEHNLARFSTNLYHHPEPFWYYLPVTALALVPWIVFVIAAFVGSVRAWWAERKSQPEKPDFELQFNLFACCWIIVPVIFFSFSQSKLPGYILPAIPAGAILLADYLRRRSEDKQRVSKWLAIPHGVVAAAAIIPALLIAHLVGEKHLPVGRPLYVAIAIALVVAVGTVLTLISRTGFRLLRFVTLVPVVLVVAFVLRFGSRAIDLKMSVRPLAAELASIETHRLPIAVCGTSRELEYGLAFYRNQTVARYESGEVPAGEHLLVAPPAWKKNVDELTAGRRVTLLGYYAPQGVDYYWVGSGARTH
jgi:4-amino-4-deoxy-L-arabinose transferase-like glycosyltransferase